MRSSAVRSNLTYGYLRPQRATTGTLDAFHQELLVSPEALMKQAGLGDQRAFGELYDQLSSLVYGIILRVVRDPAMSEEVAQEVFVELWKIAPRFDQERGSVKSWIATISHRRAVDRVRSVESSRRRDTTSAADIDLVSAPADDRLFAAAEREQVRRAIDGLSTLQRESIELAYYDGLTYREVAVHLDVAEGTVKTRIRDGMKQLRTTLEESR